MADVIRDVGKLDIYEKQAIERLLRRTLRDDEQVIIRVVRRQISVEVAESTAGQDETENPTLPDWCNVYEGLSDEEIEDLERIILRRATTQ